MLVVMGIASLFMGEPGPPRAAPARESANPEYYAEAAISMAHMRCGGVTIAERLASGIVIAECRDGQRYRIAEIGGGQVSVDRCPRDGSCE
jgi:hypothetical protein